METTATTPREGATIPYTVFSPARQTFILTLVTATAFLAPLTGNIYLPALHTLARAFHVSELLINITVGLFMLVFAIGPLLWSTLADAHGRKPLYTYSLLLYIFTNTALAASPAHYAVLLTLRILQALGSSSAYSLSAGVIADVFAPHLRGRAISVFSLGPQLGPIAGPAVGGLIVGKAGWRWLFGMLTVLGFTLLLLILFCLPETLRLHVGNGEVYRGKPWVEVPKFSRAQTSVNKSPTPGPSPRSRESVYSLCKYPPVILCCVNMALLFGSYYCIAITYPSILAERYGYTATEIGLAYLGPGVGMVLGSLSSGQISDRLFSRLNTPSSSSPPPSSEKGSGTPRTSADPECRLPLQLPGTLLFPLGILLFGWSAHFHLHPSCVIVGASLCGVGMAWAFNINTTYLTLVRPGQAATLVAVNSLFRNPAAAIASVVVDPLVRRMGVGWCFVGVAGVDVACSVIVLVLMRRGQYWRKEMEKHNQGPVGSNGTRLAVAA